MTMAASSGIQLPEKFNFNTPLRKIPRSFQNVLQIEALQFGLGSKFIQERNQRF